MKHLLHHLPFLLFILLLLPWFPPAISSTLSAMADHSQHMEYIWLVPALLLNIFKRRRVGYKPPCCFNEAQIFQRKIWKFIVGEIHYNRHRRQKNGS